MNKEIIITYDNEGDKIDPTTFAHYLLKFNRVYEVASKHLEGIEFSSFETKQSVLIQEIRKSLSCRKPRFVILDDSYTASKGTASKGFEIVGIVYGSKLQIRVRGMITALVVAAILSGGEVNIYKGEFKLNSLGTGLVALKEVFFPEIKEKTVERGESFDFGKPKQTEGEADLGALEDA